MNVDGDSIDNPEINASVFNEHFLSVAEKTPIQDTNITTTTHISQWFLLIHLSLLLQTNRGKDGHANH